jgi:hypothetical protein
LWSLRGSKAAINLIKFAVRQRRFMLQLERVTVKNRFQNP